MNSIWKQLQQQQQPFFVLAPMDDVTDTVFREIVAQVAPPDLMMTEFASSDGYAHPEGRASVERRLRVNETEAALGVPLIAQIWGSNPDHYLAMARDLAARGLYAGIDINMGCPEKGIVKRGCCGGLIKEENWDNAAAIIAATKKGAGDLPVSVKTRIGFNRIVTDEWCSHLLRQGITALTIHGRTVREMSRVPAHWDEIARVAKLRDQIAPHTVIIGNGDILSRKQGNELTATSGVDGIMIGRGVLQNLWAFAQEPTEHSPQERADILLEHMQRYADVWGDSKSYDPLKKFCKLYISGFPGAAELRARLMETRNIPEARAVIADSGLLTQPLASA